MRLRTLLLGLLALSSLALPFGEGIGNDLGDPRLFAVATPNEGERFLPSLLIVEVLPHAPRDNELVTLGNPGEVSVDGRGWTLTDGEGSWTLPSVPIAAGGTIRVTRNGTALWEDAGLWADVCVLGCSTVLSRRGSLALRNEGDGLQLIDGQGRLVDAFLYGEGSPISGWSGPPAPGLGRGHLARRQLGETGWLDTDRSTDWGWNRTFRLGQSNRTLAFFKGVPAQPLLSPEDGLERLLAVLGEARERIELAGFTFTNPHLAAALRAAVDRGVRVRMGLEASPPGGVGPEGEQILSDLARAGAQILLMSSAEGAWRRYAFHHAKYVIIDGISVVVGSENFSQNGFPTGPGNRGWGVAIEDSALAGWLHDVWREDWNENRSDIQSLAVSSRFPADVPRSYLPAKGPAALADVRAFLAPDNAATEDGLLGVLARAQDRIDAELFYLRWWWGESLSPLVAGLLEAANRGVATRILLDGQPYNVEGAEDNDEAVRRLNQLAADRDLPIEARLFDGDPQGVVKIHNKGLLVDGNRVWISSMNWNEAGAYANRELALLVESPEIATVFQEAFDADWAQGTPLGTPSLAAPEGDLLLAIGLGSAAAAGAWWWVLRTTKEPTSKHPRKRKSWRRRLKRLSSPFRRRRSRSTRTAR